MSIEKQLLDQHSRSQAWILFNLLVSILLGVAWKLAATRLLRIPSISIAEPKFDACRNDREMTG